MKTLKWGIVGLGNIAHAFVKDLQLLKGHAVTACASRSESRAELFARYYDIPRSYGSYSELFQDAQVDIVYIATPHDSHAALSIAAMQQKKHVLCEKPLAVNAKQVRSIIKAARANEVFMMEAFWSRFNPSIQAALEHVKSGTIGAVNYLNADFTFFREDPADSRMLSMDLAGGSLLDMGVYPVFLAYMIFGKPKQVLATGRFHPTGVDLQTAALLKYENGIANIMSGFKSQSDMVAKIYGTNGRIFIHPVWHEAQGYTLIQGNDGQFNSQTISLPTKGKGFTYEIMECKKCIAENKMESTAWSHQHSQDLIEIVDEIRAQMGLKYPFE